MSDALQALVPKPMKSEVAAGVSRGPTRSLWSWSWVTKKTASQPTRWSGLRRTQPAQPGDQRHRTAAANGVHPRRGSLPSLRPAQGHARGGGDAARRIGDEGYVIHVTPYRILIAANSPARRLLRHPDSDPASARRGGRPDSRCAHRRLARHPSARHLDGFRSRRGLHGRSRRRPTFADSPTTR